MEVKCGVAALEVDAGTDEEDESEEETSSRFSLKTLRLALRYA